MAATARGLDSSSAPRWLRGFEPVPEHEDAQRFPLLLPPLPTVVPGESETVRLLRSALDPAIASRLRSASELASALARHRREDSLPTRLEPLDELLGGGLPRGRVIEIAARRAAGRFSIVLASLAAATTAGEAAALIDAGDHFDPQLAEAAGVDLRRLLWIRPQTMRQAVMSAEMITVSGFQLVVVDGGLHPLKGRPPDAAWVRLTRAAEAHGAAMLVSVPYPLTGTSSEALVTIEARAPRWIGRPDGPKVLVATSIEVTIEKHRHRRAGKRATLTFVTADAAGAGRDASS